MFFEHVSTEVTLFFILYGITGVVPLMAAVYLLLGRGNVFAPDVTPPVRLRRWAASFFAASVLGHVWWYLFYMYSSDVNSVWFLLVILFDYVGMVITIAGTLLSMLQDRKRRIWLAFVAMIPFSVFMVLHFLYPEGPFEYIGTAYNLLLYVLFSAYMVYAVRQYGRWLNDNYADLENKKVWLSQVVSLVFLLFFILYAVVDVQTSQIYVLHVLELVFYGILLWRVETLPQLESISTENADATSDSETAEQENVETPARRELTVLATVDLANIEGLLVEHCVNTQLYLEHDLTLHQLAQTIGTNRSYLSQYFSRQGITYNTYINNLRINYFISRYQESITSRHSVVALQLAHESGYNSYSTFSLAFKQRTGQSVTAWMRDMVDSVSGMESKE
jgi:AraC-like DNA-binding protein